MTPFAVAQQLHVSMALAMGALDEHEAAMRLGVSVEDARRLLRDLAPHRPCLMPIAADINRETIELFDLAGATLSEPFLRGSVDRFQGMQRLHFEVGYEVLLEASARRARAPDALIFHVGRCGSTLLTNLLSASQAHVVLREPDVVSHLMAGMLLAPAAERARLAAVLQASVLYSSAVADRMFPARSHLLKLSAWNVLLGQTLLNSFPNLPAVFVHRSPVDTVASLLAVPPGWAQLVDRPREVQARFFPTLCSGGPSSPASAIELYAHAFRSCAEAALELPRERVTFVDYQELVSDPRACVRRVLAHFEQAVSAEQIERMAAASTVYSKDPSGKAQFSPGGAHLRSPLSAEQRALVERVTQDAWHALQRATITN